MEAHWHLLLNHLPIIGTLIGALVCIAGYVFRNAAVKRIASSIFIFSAAFAIPAYLTGEGAEEAIEHLPGVDKNFIEKHEDVALIFIWLISALGLAALIALVTDITKKTAAKFAYGISLILSIAVLVTSYQLGNSGGEIRHPEIRSGVQSNLIEEPGDD